MPPLTIRRAGLADLEAVVRVGVETYQEHFAQIWSPAKLREYLHREFARDALAEQLSTPETTAYLLAEREGEAIGFAKMRYPRLLPVSLQGPIAAQVPAPPHHGIELQKIYFYGAHTGGGAGTQLLRACVELASALPHQPLWLCVLDRNPRAKQLYAREGFVEVGQSDFENDLGKHPMWIMARPRS